MITDKCFMDYVAYRLKWRRWHANRNSTLSQMIERWRKANLTGLPSRSVVLTWLNDYREGHIPEELAKEPIE